MRINYARNDGAAVRDCAGIAKFQMGYVQTKECASIKLASILFMVDSACARKQQMLDSVKAEWSGVLNG